MDQGRIKGAADALLALPPKEATAAKRQHELRSVEDDTPSEPPSQPLGDYLAHEPEVPPVLVLPGIVLRGAVTMTIGRAGKGKTMMNLNRLLAWSGGRAPFPGHAVLAPSAPLKTLVVECEGAATMFFKKVQRMLDNGGFTPEQRDLILTNFNVWGDGGYSGLRLDKEEGVLQIRQEMERLQPDILFIEPLRFLYSGEENSSTEMANVLGVIVGLAAEFQCGVILSHHERKGGIDEDGEMMSLARGSTAIEGAVDVLENWRAVKGGDFRELSWSKNRYEESPAAMRVHWDHSTHWYSLIPAAAGVEEILQTLTEAAGPMAVGTIAEELGETVARVRRDLAKLMDEEPPRIRRQQVPGQGYMYRIINADEEGMDY